MTDEEALQNLREEAEAAQTAYAENTIYLAKEKTLPLGRKPDRYFRHLQESNTAWKEKADRLSIWLRLAEKGAASGS